MAALIRNFCFYCLLFLWTLAMPLFALPFFRVQCLLRNEPGHIAARRVNQLYGRGWQYVIRPWVSFTKVGLASENFPRPCIVVANHQSFFDIHCLANVPNGNITFTVRSWPFRLPLYGPFMRMAKYLNLETAGWDELMRQVADDAATGAAIVFFPEGHRNTSGNIARFHAGAFAVAIAAKLPIVPVCINGTGRVLPPGTPWISPGHVRIQALSPVFPGDFAHEGENAARMLRKHVQARMRHTMKDLATEHQEKTQEVV